MDKYIAAKVGIHGTKATVLESNSITVGLTGAVVQLIYDDDLWQGMRKKVTFRGPCKIDVLTDENEVQLPWEVTTAKNVPVCVGVTGVDAAEKVLIPTVWATIGTVLDSAAGHNPAPGEPVPPVWAQVFSIIGELEKLDTENRENLVAAINEVLSKVGTGGGNVDLSGYATEEWVKQYVKDSAQNVDLTGVVKSVNGQTPDENGNVEISVSGGSGGVSSAARTLLINILRSAVFTNDQSANITALESALSSGADSGGSGGGSTADYAVICNLTNVKSSNISAGILHGNSYITMLIADEGYVLSTVTVTMANEDVTSSVYSNGVITIASVTGNVVITATAVADVGNLVANWDFMSGSLIDSVDGLEATMSDTTTQDSTGVKILSASDYLIFPTANMAGKRVEVKFGAMEFYTTPTSKHGRLYTWCVRNSTNFSSGFYWRKDGFWAVSATPTDFTDINMFANNTLVVEYDADTNAYYYFDGRLIAKQTPGKTLERSCISTPSGKDPFYNVTVESIKIYDALIYTAVS